MTRASTAIMLDSRSPNLARVPIGRTALPVGGLEPGRGSVCPAQAVNGRQHHSAERGRSEPKAAHDIGTHRSPIMKTIGGVVTGLPQGLKGSSFVHSRSFTCSASTEPSSARARRVTRSGVPLRAAAG